MLTLFLLAPMLAIRFHVETFGDEALLAEPPVLEAFVAEAGVAI